MTNYLGKQRLKKILFNYLSNRRPLLLAELRRECKEYHNVNIISYRRGHDSEWLETKVHSEGTIYCFKLWASGSSAKYISLDESSIRTVEEREKYVSKSKYHCYYDSDFNPIDGRMSDTQLVCNDIGKKKKEMIP